MNSSAVSSLQSAILTRSRTWPLLLIALPVGCFSALLLAYTVNVPWLDDIDAFLNFILGYTGSNQPADKLDWLLRPNNEHRILTAKLITLGLYYLTGSVNFRILIFVAFGFLLGILYLFYRVFRLANLPLLAFAPVPFLLLQPQHYLVSMWAITALQHQVTVLLTFIAIYQLAGQQGHGRFAGAVGLQLVASLSMSNGLFGWVAGAVVLIVQKSWLRLSIWLGLGVTTIVFYFHDFQSAQGNDTSVAFFTQYPYLVISAFFTFSGALFDFVPDLPIFRRSILPTLAGILLIALLLWLLWRMNKALLRRPTAPSGPLTEVVTSRQKQRYFFTGCYAFLMVNAVVIAFLRPRFGYSVMLVSNYMLYPAVLVSLMYMNLLSELNNPRSLTRLIPVGLAISLMVWSVSYMIWWPKIAYRRQFLLASAGNQKHNDIGLGPTWGTPFATFTNQIMHKTVAQCIYNYPDKTDSPYEQALAQPVSTAPIAPLVRLAVLSESSYSRLIQTTGGIKRPITGLSAIVIESAGNTYLVPSETPFDFRTFWLRRPVKAIRAEIINGMLAPKTYRVGILLSEDGVESTKQFSSQPLQIP